MSYRFAIIGCGAIASRHAEQIAAIGRLVAVCDTDRHRMEDFSRRYQVNGYADREQLLSAERPDVVVVCTPNGLHPRHCLSALAAGCHVLCEKPLAIDTGAAARMAQAAQQAGRRLFVVKQNRFNPPVTAVKKLLDEGKLGRIGSFQLNCFWNRPARYYNDSWHGTQALDGGLLFTQFSHFIDLLYWFLGDMESASGWRVNALHQGIIEFEDAGVASLVMKNGAVGAIHYTINSHASNMEGSFTLFGEKGTVKIGGQYLNRIDHFSVDNETAPSEAPSRPNDYGHYQGSMSNHHLVYRELIQALADPAHPAVEAAEALQSVSIIERIYAASPLITTGQSA